MVVDDDTYYRVYMSSNHTFQVYYKVRQLISLQRAMVCYYKVRQLFYYKVRQVLLQSATLNIVLSKVIFFSSQVFGFILVLRTRLAKFILETNYLSRRIIRRTDNSSKYKSEDEF